MKSQSNQSATRDRINPLEAQQLEATAIRAANGTESTLQFSAAGQLTWVSHALVDDDDCYVELLRQAHEVAQVLAQLLLPLRQLPAPCELHAE
jgi:SH3-like domain-containing protein